MARARVSSVLTSVQIAELRVLRDAAAADYQSISGKWRPVYDKFRSFIGGDAGPVANVDHNVWLWLRGPGLSQGGAADRCRPRSRLLPRAGITLGGKTVISYRGTDAAWNAASGWVTGAGAAGARLT